MGSGLNDDTALRPSIWGWLRSSRQLQRLAAGVFGFAFAEHSTWLAITVYAFSRGGAREAGLVAAVQLLPATVLAPLLVRLVESLTTVARRLQIGYAAQCAAMAATAVAMHWGTWFVTYAGAIIAAVSLTVTRPMLGAALPAVARNPRELVAANVIVSTTEHVGNCIGPLCAGVLIATTNPAAVFGVASISTLVGALIGRVGERASAPDADADVGVGAVVGADAAVGAAAVVGAAAASAVGTGSSSEDGDLNLVQPGVLSLFASSAVLRWVVAVLSVAALVAGVADVASVLVAVDRLRMDEGVAGLLVAALGFGSIIGAALSGRLLGGARVRRALLFAGVACGVAFATIGLSTSLGPTLVAFAVAGCGQALIVMIGNVMMQRRAPTAALGRLFGVAEGAHLLFLALGSLVVALLADEWSTATSLVVLGVVIVVLVVGGAVRLASLGALAAPPPAEVYERIAADSLFEPLAIPSLERLAAIADSVTVPTGTTIIRRGEVGDRYYLIVDGCVRVESGDGFVRDMRDGESFGELALLHDAPRSATVTALDDTTLLTIDADEFLLAVTGHPLSRRRARATTSRYLG